MIFDSTTHVDEAIAPVVCFADSAFQIQQCLVKFQLPAKSFNGQELECVLVFTLSTKLSAELNDLVTTMYDRTSVDNVAMETSLVHPKVVLGGRLVLDESLSH